MKATLLTVGIILLVVGLIGLAMSLSAVWMWVLIILGLVGVIWGWIFKKPTSN